MASGYSSKNHVQLNFDNIGCRFSSSIYDPVIHWQLIRVHHQVTALKVWLSFDLVDNEKAMWTFLVESIYALDHSIFLFCLERVLLLVYFHRNLLICFFNGSQEYHCLWTCTYQSRKSNLEVPCCYILLLPDNAKFW